MFSLNKMTFGLVCDTKSYAKNDIIKESIELEKLNLSEIVQVDFPENQYYREQTDKKQIILHHTVSGYGVDGDISWWLQTADRVATTIIIDWTGKIYQCFSSKYWGHHIGLHAANNRELNKSSVSIEIDAWGGLIRSKNLWYPAKWDIKEKQYVPNKKVKAIKNVQIYEEGFKGFYGFEKYTTEQIEAVRKLLVFWGEMYNIPLTYNEDMWDVSNNAISGKPGVWTHVSYRKDKSDCHPQPELIQMLKSLT